MDHLSHSTLHTLNPSLVLRMVNLRPYFFPAPDARDDALLLFPATITKLSPISILNHGYLYGGLPLTILGTGTPLSISLMLQL